MCLCNSTQSRQYSTGRGPAALSRLYLLYPAALSYLNHSALSTLTRPIPSSYYPPPTIFERFRPLPRAAGSAGDLSRRPAFYNVYVYMYMPCNIKHLCSVFVRVRARIGHSYSSTVIQYVCVCVFPPSPLFVVRVCSPPKPNPKNNSLLHLYILKTGAGAGSLPPPTSLARMPPPRLTQSYSVVGGKGRKREEGHVHTRVARTQPNQMLRIQGKRIQK